jgi:hypothetical protein
MKKAVLLRLIFFLTSIPFIIAQESELSFSLWPAGSIPLGPETPGGGIPYTMGGGADFLGSWQPPFAAFLRLGGIVSYISAPTTGSDTLSMVRVGADVAMPIRIAGPLSFQFAGMGGYNLGLYGGATGSYPWAGARTALIFEFSPSFGLGLGASFKEVFGLYRGVDVSIGVSFSPGARGRTARLEYAETELGSIYPVFHKYYDVNPIGTIMVTNAESSTITDVQVTLFVKSYMDAPKTCATLPRLAKGETAKVPLMALFNQSILAVTEGTKASAEVEVRYRVGRTEMISKYTVSLNILYRNAMTWDDDRKAASFVTAKDPAVLTFAKSTAGSVREADSSGFILQFRQALALFETLSVYGINYVVDPASSYAALSAADASLDYLQFPGQTLTYRAGDCDDLTVLYCALLESAGLETAFITVPGHIYAAFCPGIDPQAASRYFSHPGDYIVSQGRLWIPVEITMVHDGFLKAWQEGARQWREAAKKEQAALYPVRDAWKLYEPTASSDDARIIVPDNTKVMARYDEAWKKVVSYEIADREKILKESLAKRDDPAVRNRLGVLYASFAMYDQAEAQFAAGMKAQHAPCIVNLANINFTKGNMAEALTLYQGVLQFDESNIAALMGVARTEYERSNLASAKSWYEKLQVLSPTAAASCVYIVQASSNEDRADASRDRTRVEWTE